MGETIFLLCYLILLMIMIKIEVSILSNGKREYLKLSYQALGSICEEFADKNFEEAESLSFEVNRFYHEYAQEMPQLKKYYPNVVAWIDAIIFRIDSGRKGTATLKQYVRPLKAARDILEQKNPFNKCEKYQQGILTDLMKLKVPENEGLVQNIANRTEEEFLRLSGDIKRNSRLNVVSIAIGAVGIVVSILMAIIKFN